ncbi:Uncharacterised protein [Serratia marcescens]|uniref:Uncharacterized protein n=1 Tax=Serratia marcescens TaxID=615 RepID=A0A379YEV3_SERMA|nr:Uncharacterised protein [Serratia marcescens]
MDHRHQQQHGADQHHQPLHGVVQHAGAEAAEGGVQRDADAEDQQAGVVRNAGGGLQQACAADELHRHGAEERHQQAEAGQPHQQAALVAAIQHVIESNGVVAPRQDGEFLAQHAERQPHRRQLDHRQQHPAQAIFVGGARPADKRTGADVGGGQGHRQHKAAHRAVAEEIFAEEVSVLAAPIGVHRQAEHQQQVGDQRQDHFSLHRGPPAKCRGTPCAPSASTGR